MPDNNQPEEKPELRGEETTAAVGGNQHKIKQPAEEENEYIDEVTESEEDRETLVTSGMVALHIESPTVRSSSGVLLKETDRDNLRGLTCAALNASWSRQERVVSLNCDVVACNPPMADRPLLNSSELRGNVAVIQRGTVSFGAKAAYAVAAGVVGIIFVNNGLEMIAPQLEEWRDSDTLNHVPAICLDKPSGDSLHALLHARRVRTAASAAGNGPRTGLTLGESHQFHVRWWDLTTSWAAQRIQTQWRRCLLAKQRAAQSLDEITIDMLWNVIDSEQTGSVRSDDFYNLTDTVDQMQEGMKVGHLLRSLKDFTLGTRDFKMSEVMNDEETISKDEAVAFMHSRVKRWLHITADMAQDLVDSGRLTMLSRARKRSTVTGLHL